jgi:hypothetical protein
MDKGRFKPKVLEYHYAKGADESFRKSVDSVQTIVFTDKSTSYVNIPDHLVLHINKKFTNKTNSKIRIHCN